MANELKFQVGIVYANGPLADTVQNHQLQVNQLAPGMDALAVTVGTSEQDVVPPDIATLGWVYIKNLDANNFISYGPKSGGAMVGFGKLLPGEETPAIRLLPGITLRCKADTAPCSVLFRFYNA